ncbi:MAG: hypothetical protein HYR88_03955 [Verrucomicrobia bacterium]|nr:hypothetical protein [Verrucomicrobiota bacterium]
MSGRLVLNTFVLSLSASALALLWGAAVSLWMGTLGSRARAAMGMLVALTLALPPFLSPGAWMDLLSVGGAGGSVSVITTPLGSLPAAALLMAGQTWPLACLVWNAIWVRIPRELYECEPALSGWNFMRHLLWPEARAALPLAAVVILLLNLNQFTIPSLLQIKVVLADVWTQYSTHLSAGRALLAAWPLILIPALLAWTTRLAPTETAHSLDNLRPRRFARQLGLPWTIALATTTGVVLTMSLAIPLWTLVRKAAVWRDLAPAFDGARGAWLSSLLSATFTATFLLLASFLIQAALLRRSTKRRNGPVGSSPVIRAMGYGAWVLFFVPGLLLSIGLLTLFSSAHELRAVRNSSAFALLGLALRYSAIGWHGARAALQRVNRDLLESTAISGASLWDELRGFLLPSLLPRLLAAWYAVYVLVLWDVEIPLLLQVPGGETLALRIFNLLHYGHNAHVSALCLHMLLLAILPGMGWLVFQSLAKLRTAMSSRAAAASLIAAMAGAGCSPQPGQAPASSSASLFSRVEIVGGRGTGAGEFNKPRSLTVDHQDNLYVVDMTGRVQKFSPDGRFLLVWQLPQTDLGKPKGMTCDAAGNIIVVEPHYQRVNHFSPE